MEYYLLVNELINGTASNYKFKLKPEKQVIVKTGDPINIDDFSKYKKCPDDNTQLSVWDYLNGYNEQKL